MLRPRILVLTVAVVVLVALVLGLVRRKAVGTAVPESDLLHQISPTQVRDQIVARAAPLTVVNFWASWCEPCKHEFPHYLRLAREFGDRGVRLMLVSVDDRADFAEADAFLRQNGVDFPTFYKGDQSLNFVAEIYPPWTGAVPVTVLFGPKGEILDAWEGETTWTALEKKISKRLAKP